MYIRNPVEWSLDQIKFAGTTIETLIVARRREELRAAPTVGRITVADIKDALRKGLNDVAAFRDDVVLICLIYPIAGLILGGGSMASLVSMSSWASVISVRSWKVPAGPVKVPTAIRSSSLRSFDQLSWQALSVTRASSVA